MVTLPWLSGGGGNGSSNLFDYLMASQPTAGQSIASSLPFLNLPKKQAQYMQPAYDTTNAMVDVDNPLYKKIYGQQKEQGQQNLAESIMEISRQNRKLSGMGRTPLLDRERGGEQTFRTLSRGYQDVQNQAAGDTRNILSDATKNYYVMGQSQGQTAAKQAGVKGNLLGALVKLFGL